MNFAHSHSVRGNRFSGLPQLWMPYLGAGCLRVRSRNTHKSADRITRYFASGRWGVKSESTLSHRKLSTDFRSSSEEVLKSSAKVDHVFNFLHFWLMLGHPSGAPNRLPRFFFQINWVRI